MDLQPAMAHQQLYLLADGLETPVQVIYLFALLGFLGVGAYLVVRQVLIRRELDEAAKALGERIRTGSGSCEVCEPTNVPNLPPTGPCILAAAHHNFEYLITWRSTCTSSCPPASLSPLIS